MRITKTAVYALVVVLGLIVAVPAAPRALAGQSTDEAVRKVLVDRAKAVCRDMLSSFLVSQVGIDDPKVRALTADCYLAESRLFSLGLDRDVIREGTALSELPARMLSQETRMSLDPYLPLAGRALKIPPEGK